MGKVSAPFPGMQTPWPLTAGTPYISPCQSAGYRKYLELLFELQFLWECCSSSPPVHRKLDIVHFLQAGGELLQHPSEKL
jgi:hypothetical protein